MCLESEVLVEDDSEELGRLTGLNNLPITKVQGFTGPVTWAGLAPTAWRVKVNELELRGFKKGGMGGGSAEAPAPVVLPQSLAVSALTITSHEHRCIINIAEVVRVLFGGPPFHKPGIIEDIENQ